MKEDLEFIKKRLYLENTGLIYHGIKELYEDLKQDSKKDKPWDPELKWEEYMDYVKRAYYDAVAKNEIPNQWRYQNKFKDFFRFIQKDEDETNEINEDKICMRVARILCLYDCVASMIAYGNNNEDKYIPYYFERLCNIMLDIVGGDMCYLVHYQADRYTCLASSGYSKRIGEYSLENCDFSSIFFNRKDGDTAWFDGSENEWSLSNSWIKKKSILEGTDCKFSTLTLRLAKIRQPKGTESDECFYIVFQEEYIEKGESTISRSELRSIREILFLRAKLVKLAYRYLPTLLLSQTTYRYVAPLDEKQELTILHLTDLHIKTKEKSEFKEYFDQFPDSISDILDPDKRRHFDLVVITGDIVQGQVSAGELEEHYLLSNELLRKLAFKLWHYAEDRIRADWKKRLIIIPGNHDYASMNELEVVSQKGMRSTGTGRPAQKEGGPMVKFAYYIHFIRQLLGIDLEEQVNGWLNDVRHYDQMGISFVCLNSSAGAGPLRNNKVFIGGESIETLEMRGGLYKNKTICLVHHTPCYEPNYALDRYGLPQKIKIMEPCVIKFAKALSMDVKTEAGNIENILSAIQRDLIDNELEETSLMVDVTYYKTHFRHLTNERCEAIRSAMNRDNIMQKADMDKLKEVFDHVKQNMNTQIFLGGHIHQERRNDTEKCYEGPLFYHGNSIEFAVLRLHMDALNFEWIHYKQSDPGTHPVEVNSIARVTVPLY